MAGGASKMINSNYVGPFITNGSFSSQFETASTDEMVSRGIDGAASGINRRMGAENSLAQQFAIPALSTGLSLVKSAASLAFGDSKRANQKDQNRRAASFFEGWAVLEG
ncbi:MAG: hypothetical protein CMN76_13520 [Spirochaetaceae bacterium]|nr:hypothetical protein [Spirochaetaceae bacterium]